MLPCSVPLAKLGLQRYYANREDGLRVTVEFCMAYLKKFMGASVTLICWVNASLSSESNVRIKGLSSSSQRNNSRDVGSGDASLDQVPLVHFLFVVLLTILRMLASHETLRLDKLIRW